MCGMFEARIAEVAGVSVKLLLDEPDSIQSRYQVAS